MYRISKVAKKMKKPLVKCEKTSGIYTLFSLCKCPSSFIDLVSLALLPPLFTKASIFRRFGFVNHKILMSIVLCAKKKKVDEKYDATRIKALPAVTFFQKLTFRAARFLDNVFTETTRRTLPEIPLLLSKLVVIRRPLTYRSCSSSIGGRIA